MEEEMEEKEKLERGEIVEKKPTVSPSERTGGSTAATTVETPQQLPQPTEAEGPELTAETCEAKLADLKAELGRDTSFDRLELSKRRMDGVYNSGPWNQWDQWDGWNPNPPPPPAPSGPGYQLYSGQDSQSYETGTGGHSSQYRSVRPASSQVSRQQTTGTCRGRPLQRQDASAYTEERYHTAGLYDGPGSQQERYWLDHSRQQNGFSHSKPGAGGQYGGARNGYGGRRRLPCETMSKKKPWHTMITGWSSDDLAKAGYSQYNGGGVLANGYPVHRVPPDHTVRQGRQLPMVPGTNQSKVLLNQRSLPEDYSDSYMRETHSSKLNSYLRQEPFQHFPCFLSRAQARNNDPLNVAKEIKSIGC